MRAHPLLLASRDSSSIWNYSFGHLSVPVKNLTDLLQLGSKIGSRDKLIQMYGPLIPARIRATFEPK